jgi:hypothetical protein
MALADYTSPALAAMQAFVADTAALTRLMVAAGQGFATDGLAAASAFADTAGKALGLLANGVSGFQGAGERLRQPGPRGAWPPSWPTPAT